MEIASYIVNLIGLGAILLASLVKGEKMKQVLLLLLVGNLAVGIGYLLGGSGINGAVSCFVGVGQTVVSAIFEIKHRPVPKWVVGIYALSFIVVNLLFGGVSFYTFLVIAACMTFIMGILQKSGRGYRLWTVGNTVLWSTYDLLTGTYSALITHATMFVVNMAGILIHDLKKKEKGA